MSAPRFFVVERCAAGARIALSAGDAHHAFSVLRLRDGDEIVIVSAGTAWNATIAKDGKGRAHAIVAGARDERGGELPVEVTVLQALVKGTKFDDVVEKVVELGARRIVPVRCERSYAQAGEAKLARWRRIARAAAAQSRRRFLPTVDQPTSWSDAAQAAGGSLLVAYENAEAGTFDQAVERARQSPSIAIAIGPEGGFSSAEIDAARAAGAAFVSLGPSILRTETAAAAMLAALAATAGWW
ncbi:MAG: 16S rRNA (uracil(1498)-N(3))-methyltransferase [Candidatus Eremiobacteraeota bacterium]|nr:16S rRNA (uracil(1498)-N(3))-methyltransferase [Candidatus Eremiobacteraeota bacterium]